ncbi:MAG: chromate resistance protein ChrB domain-containing protein [Reichenbachiella sp.]|uniref:chromate resistance protein ChrB domain-containing protein n=1 Tax=Reichenbachiella sp. TaxID=2184521 RepID=UPI00326473F7
MKWITREKPKIDRLACPWLISRFIDDEPEFLFVPVDEVIPKAEETGAIPYDVAYVEFTHYSDQCTFDYFVKKYEIEDPAVHEIAKIVRAADTDRYDLASQAAGLWAITAGLSHNYSNDHELLDIGMVIYDALYSWAKYHKDEKHAQNPTEGMLLAVYRKFLSEKSTKKIPPWVEELKEMIQDKIDTDLTLSLKEVSSSLEVHPAYLSREFSKYFDDLNFGEYLRKLRIERAVKLLEETNYSLTEIAYLTGFSDQSHFTRIFKKQMGTPPSDFRKSMLKSKK